MSNLMSEEDFIEEQKQIHKFPSKLQMVRTFAKEMWELYKAKMDDIPPFVSADTAHHRISICEECPFYINPGRCSICGCFMDKKVNLVTAKCPEGKWDSVA